jgi:hypothetical protein
LRKGSGIVNRLARATRAAGGTVAWIQNTITPETEKSWSVWFGSPVT